MGFSQKCELSRLGLPLRPERNAQKESVRFARALELWARVDLNADRAFVDLGFVKDFLSLLHPNDPW
jgi:hypothetical protein